MVRRSVQGGSSYCCLYMIQCHTHSHTHINMHFVSPFFSFFLFSKRPHFYDIYRYVRFQCANGRGAVCVLLAQSNPPRKVIVIIDSRNEPCSRKNQRSCSGSTWTGGLALGWRRRWRGSSSFRRWAQSFNAGSRSPFPHKILFFFGNYFFHIPLLYNTLKLNLIKDTFKQL